MAKKTICEIQRYFPDTLSGLNSEQVNLRIKQKLVNNTKQKTSKSYLKIFTDNIFTFFNMLWLVIIIALILVKSYADLLFIIVVTFNTSIAIYQEIRSKKTVAKLSLVTTPKVKVVRNNETIDIVAEKIVLDDIIILSVGNQVPADCILLDGYAEVNESLLTGESRSVKKEINSELLAGSFLTSGKCFARVNKIGKDSYIQSLAKAAKNFKQPSSNLFKDLNRIIKYIGFFIIPIGLLTFFNNYYWSGVGNFADSVAKTCGSLIGMIPAGMFLLISVALTVGVIKLAERKTLVQDLYSIEMLARSNILCLDKTGTITDGTMSVSEVLAFNGKTDIEIKEIITSILKAQETHNNTSIALMKSFDTESNMQVTTNIPFSSERKYTATSFQKHGTYIIGASDYIKAKMSPEINEKIENATSSGYRVLLLAYSKKQIINDAVPKDLKAIAVITLEDTIRPDAVQTIKWFKDNDVQIKIISGDDPQTVSYIAQRVGIENAKDYINLEGYTTEEIESIATEYTVFGRVSPEQKHTLIKTLKKNNVVAMTGDGVNDTLALKEADCSIAMADGSEVARNISNLVLLNSSFTSLPTVVEEGRRVINNVQKSSTLFLMKTILTILLTLFVLIIGVNYPFKPTQMFLMEFFVIGIPSFFLALLPNKNLIRGDFVPYVLKKGLPYGVILLINIAIVLLLGKFKLISISETSTLATIILTFVAFLNLVSLCYPYSIFKTLIVIFSFAGISITGFLLSDFFGMTTLTPIVWKLAAVLALITAISLLLMKNIHILNYKELKIQRLKKRLIKIKNNVEGVEKREKIIARINSLTKGKDSES